MLCYETGLPRRANTGVAIVTHDKTSHPGDLSAAQHARLRAQLHDVEDSLAAATDRHSRARIVGQLKLDVERHFAFEETGGYFADVLRAAPRLRHEVEQMEEQHSSLLTEVSELERRASADRTERGVLTQQFDDFRRRLQDHENHENTVTQRAFENDIGPGD